MKLARFAVNGRIHEGNVRHEGHLVATGSIERKPGRHDISNALFVYFCNPNRNQREVYTNDYMIPDLDWAPIRWRINDPHWATFWSPKPSSYWFGLAPILELVEIGDLLPVSAPKLRDRPEFVT